MIKNVKLFVNEKKETKKIVKLVKDSLIKNNFNITDDKFDLGIAIGGDGTFLKMVRSTNFDTHPYYVGINCGTLGFLQELNSTEIDKLIEELLNKKYKIEKVGIQETTIYYGDSCFSKLYSLNEIIIRDDDLKMLKLDVSIGEDLLEHYTGDGLLIATSVGSTAHNISYRGSIVYNTFSTLQLTPIAPINSKAYKTLPNSLIIPPNKEIILKPIKDKKNLLVTIDGINEKYSDVNKIITTINRKQIKCLRFSHYSFTQKIKEKLL